MKGEKMNSELNIGDLVRKRSGRTFKSGNKAEQIVELLNLRSTVKPISQRFDYLTIALLIFTF